MDSSIDIKVPVEEIEGFAEIAEMKTKTKAAYTAYLVPRVHSMKSKKKYRDAYASALYHYKEAIFETYLNNELPHHVALLWKRYTDSGKE